MAKALYGHVSRADTRLVREVAELRARVRELEARLEKLEFERTIDLDRLGLEAPILEPAVG